MAFFLYTNIGQVDIVQTSDFNKTLLKKKTKKKPKAKAKTSHLKIYI